MPTKYRQKTDRLNCARVALLCLATTLVVGFTKPGDNQPVAEPAEMASTLDPITATGLSLAKADPVIDAPTNVIDLPVKRPASYAIDGTMNAVLGQVRGRRWAHPSQYSPDRVRAELNGQVSSRFIGVGFPDIRTHRKQQRRLGYSLADRNSWNRMISWRNTDDVTPEPIAHVRCMGLSPQAVANRADRYNRLILDMAVQYDVSASLIKAVITEESCFNNKAMSPVGAQGLMQLMPDTATWLKVKDPHDPEQNLRAGVRYLASLQKQFDTLELALAAYNAGPGNVRRYNGVPPFNETQAYVQKVQAHYRRYVAATKLAAR